MVAVIRVLVVMLMYCILFGSLSVDSDVVLNPVLHATVTVSGKAKKPPAFL
jgi:hypothetical protein